MFPGKGNSFEIDKVEFSKFRKELEKSDDFVNHHQY